MTALVLVAGASLFTANAADKKKSKKVAATPVVLSSSADSLSYAAGVNATRGLIPFIQQNNHVDVAYMADFIRGYQEAIAMGETPQNTAYITGMQIAQMVAQRIIPSMKQELKSAKDTISAQLFHEGFAAALAKDTTYFNAKQAEEYQKEALAGAGEQFMAENAKKPGVKVLPSGLQYKVIKEGHGEVPKSTDEVEVIYEGKLINGKVFDSTEKHGSKTDKFNAGSLIKGWTEALTTMPVGSKWELYIPYQLAYGERGAGGDIPPYSPLVFTLELVDIVKPQAEEAPAEQTEITAAKTDGKSTKAAKTAKTTKQKGKK